jgi:hypothetical protein
MSTCYLPSDCLFQSRTSKIVAHTLGPIYGTIGALCLVPVLLVEFIGCSGGFISQSEQQDIDAEEGDCDCTSSDVCTLSVIKTTDCCLGLTIEAMCGICFAVGECLCGSGDPVNVCSINGSSSISPGPPEPICFKCYWTSYVDCCPVITSEGESLI